MTRHRFVTLAVALASVAVIADARAQGRTPAGAPKADVAAADSRWAPWLGCWRATDDLAGTGANVCVTRSGGGVTLRTFMGGQTVGEESRVADDRPRPVRESGCTGTETTRWSADGLRAYHTAQASCDAEPPRTLAGVAFFVPGPVWVDVQTVTRNGATSVRVSRYTHASNQRLAENTPVPLPPAPLVAAAVSRGWITDDVVEASRVLPADGVEAAISEGPTAFRLNASSLSHMADDGVSEGVIDLVVALTYPEKFAIDRPAAYGVGVSTAGPMWADPLLGSILGQAALYDCYAPYGWAQTSYWDGCASFNRSLFSTGYYSGYYGLNGTNGRWISTSTRPEPGGGRTEGGGRVVNGRGYTRVRAIDTTMVGQRSRGRAAGTSNGTTGSSDSGSATSSGSSGGGGGGGRTAVPRPPGGA